MKGKGMDYQIEIKFKALLSELEGTFGEGLDVDSILFLIGVQELGKGPQKFNKRKKLELMHIAMCTILIPYGFYKKIGRDKDYWPHFENIKQIPPLDTGQQEHLIKEAIIQYFDDQKLKVVDEIEIPERFRKNHGEEE